MSRILGTTEYLKLNSNTIDMYYSNLNLKLVYQVSETLAMNVVMLNTNAR